MTDKPHRYFSDVKLSEEDILLFISLLKLGDKEALIGKFRNIFTNKTEVDSKISILTAKKYPISLAGNHAPVLFPEGSLGHLSGLDALVQGLESSSGAEHGLSYGEFPYGRRSIGYLNEILGDFKGYLVTGPTVICSNSLNQVKDEHEFGTISIASYADIALIAEAFNAFWVLVDGGIVKLENWLDNLQLGSALPSRIQLILSSFSVPFTETYIKQLDLLRQRFGQSNLTFALSLLDVHRSFVKHVGYFQEGWFIDKPPTGPLGTSIGEIIRSGVKQNSDYPTLGGRYIFHIPIMTVDEATKWIKELFPESSQYKFLNSIYPALKRHFLSSSFDQLSWTERLLWSFAILNTLQIEESNIFLPFCSDYFPHLINQVPNLFLQVSANNRLVKLDCQQRKSIKFCKINVEGGLNCSGFVVDNEASLTLVMPEFSSVWIVALVGPPFSGKTLLAKALARESNFDKGILKWQEDRPKSGRSDRYAPLSIPGRYLSYWPEDAVRDETFGVFSGLENSLVTIRVYDPTLYENLIGKQISLWEYVTLAQSFTELDPILKLFFRAIHGKDKLDDNYTETLSSEEDFLNAGKITLCSKLITVNPVLQRLAIIARALPNRLHLGASFDSSSRSIKVASTNSRRVRRLGKQITRIRSFLVCDHFLSDLSFKQQERLIFALAGLPEYGIAVVYTSWRSVINITGQVTVNFG